MDKTNGHYVVAVGLLNKNEIQNLNHHRVIQCIKNDATCPFEFIKVFKLWKNHFWFTFVRST